MRITEACQRLGISARMLRYRESLGLLPAVQQRAAERRMPPNWQSRPGTAGGPRPANGPGRAGGTSPASRPGPADRPDRTDRPGPAGGPRPAGGPGTADRPGPAGRPGLAKHSGPAGRPGPAGTHRQFNPADLDAVALGLAIEQRYDISPNALAFGLRVLSDPHARAQVAEFGRRIGRIRPTPALAMDFEKERAQRLLGQSPGNSPDISQ